MLKKLQIKESVSPLLIHNAPTHYIDLLRADDTSIEIHAVPEDSSYPFIQVFATSNESLQIAALELEPLLVEEGLLWLCYPKKSSKTFKGSNCSRETVGALLAERDYEPVRQIAIDEDWSALRLRKVEHIKKMTRKVAVTKAGQERISN
ncbi:DUF3052 domain-containing protein [Bacillus sp. HMF5848]|uniref:DUF3052 domain-containing protein n=1 Tax=Bacillus sp. HMF5848 TaxID=2495421 RepID=UPI000F76ADF9|nr:DUF3052 domain-containing protein [Bacillus sp. HMF5848]RSK29022.1 DUF3052 domain-containing protein [Bacillus sp. HMF5848]